MEPDIRATSNQAPPLVGHNVVTSDRALVDGLLAEQGQAATGEQAYDATAENAYTGDYPLSRFLYVYVNARPGGDGGASPIVRRPRRDVVLGVNIGKTKLVPEEEAVRDYEKSTRLLAPLAVTAAGCATRSTSATFRIHMCATKMFAPAICAGSTTCCSTATSISSWRSRSLSSELAPKR